MKISNEHHRILLNYIRTTIPSQPDDENYAKLHDLSDHEVIRLLFSNYHYRRENNSGLRLSKFGLAIMRLFFQSYEITMPPGEHLNTGVILYLNIKCTKPYYFDNKCYVLFDKFMAVQLRLADSVATLIEIEGIH